MKEMHAVSAFIPGTALAGAALFGSLAAADDVRMGGYEVLQEVVVTANKRSEKLQDVPTAISVMSGAKLEAEGIAQFADYVRKTPVITAIGNGRPGTGYVIIRGIATGGSGGPLTAIYLDETPFTPSSPLAFTARFVFDPDLADIERIEVLEGPQSTLYGASAVGGLIKVVTHKPDLNEVDGTVRLDGLQVDDGEAGYAARGSVNIPLVSDRVALRASAFHRRDPGYITNLYNGEQDVNWARVSGGRLALRIKLTDALETTFNGLLQDIRAGATTGFNVDANLNPVNGQLAHSTYFTEPAVTEYRAFGNTTTLEASFGTFTNVLSYARLFDDVTSDASSFLPLAPTAPAGSVASIRNKISGKRLSNELRLASNPGRIEWLLAGFYTEEDDPYAVTITGINPATGAPLVPPNDNIYTYPQRVEFEEKALFGNLTFHFTDALEGTIGTRYSENSEAFHAARSGLLGSNPLIGSSSDSASSYLATLSYRLVPEVTLYVRAASAYRPGATQPVVPGFTGDPHFGPDTLWNYEAGAKGSLLDGLVTFTSSVYRMKWSNIQVNTRFQQFLVIANAASAQIDGAQLTLQLAPVDGLSVELAGAYNDGKITSDAPAVGAADGDRLPFSSEFSGTATVDYRFGLSPDVTANVGATYAYRTSRDTGFSLSAARYTLPAYGALDLRAGLEWSRYMLQARVDNATNEYALTGVGNATDRFSTLTGTIIRPRTFALSFTARF